MIPFLRWVLIGITGAVIGVTLYEAGWGNDVGRVFMGLAVAIAGVFLVALWGDYERPQPGLDLGAYCEVCGDEMVAMVGEYPLCLTHFRDALEAIGEKK